MSCDYGPQLTQVSVSFTGSERVGKEVGKVVQDRFGKASRLSVDKVFV